MVENLAKKHNAQMIGYSGDRYLVRFNQGTFWRASIFNTELLDRGYRVDWTRKNNCWIAEVYHDEF